MMSEILSYSSEATKDREVASHVWNKPDQQIGRLLRQARKDAGLTQRDVAALLHTRNSAISRIENHGDDIRFSTLERFAKAVGYKLTLELRPSRKA